MYSFSLRTYICRCKPAVFSVRHHACALRARVSVKALTTAPPRQRDEAPENFNVRHSRFLAEGTILSKWNKGIDVPESGATPSEDADTLSDGKGKLSQTSSHLFKLILPLGRLRSNGSPSEPPTVFLLHPSQPLSHISRLIAASLTPEVLSISFRNTSPRGRQLQWSDSTDVGDFIRYAARATEFDVYVEGTYGKRSIEVEVPTFADRTRFLRRRLQRIERDVKEMEELKHCCDLEARQGARRIAVGGLGMLVVYWGTVARLTFWDLGWDIMEPVTYLSSLSMVILGYLWFLYQGREVTYSSVLDRSISTRRQALYKAHGFDVETWVGLIAEAKALRREISRIAEDYDERTWNNHDEEKEDRDVQELRKTVSEDQESQADSRES